MDPFSQAMFNEPIGPFAPRALTDVFQLLRNRAPPIEGEPQIPPLVYDNPGSPRLVSTPEITIDERLIRGLLTRDFISRKTRCWPLLNDDEMNVMLKLAAPYIKGSFGNVYVKGESYFVPRIFSSPAEDEPRNNNWNTMGWAQLEARTMHRLEEGFPLITVLLENFHGRLIAAGGAVTKALTQTYCCSEDIDMFFIDPEVESDTVSETAKQNKATAFLLETVAYLVDQWLNRPPQQYSDDESRVAYVFRGEFVTTVWLVGEELEPTKYQFIHRIYPTVGSVLGGFDLGPAMIAFTGRKILATEMGAWSALAKTIIVDVSRRSTSFEHRLVKYGHFCHLIFVGLAADTQPWHMLRWLDIEIVDDLIHQTITEKGFRFDEGSDSIDLIPLEVEYSREEVAGMLYEKAAECGYDIIGGLDLRCLRSGPVNGSESLTVENLKIMLVTLAYVHGYHLNVEELLLSHRTNYRVVGPRSKEIQYHRSYLHARKPVLHLAKVSICHDRDVKPTSSSGMDYSKKWNLRVRRDVEYAATTDYDHEIAFWPVSDTKETMISDYETNKVYPDLMVIGNFTVFHQCKDLVAPVVAIQCFKNSSTQIDNPYQSDGDLRYISRASLSAKAINVDGKKIVPFLQAGLTSPDFGDCKFILDTYQNDKRFDELRLRLTGQIEASKQHLMGVRWILRNPGTQWTSSINPIVKDPRDWYGQCYRSYRVGNQAIESCLRLARLRRGNPFSAGMMGRDVFNIILRTAIWQDSLLSITL